MARRPPPPEPAGDGGAPPRSPASAPSAVSPASPPPVPASPPPAPALPAGIVRESIGEQAARYIRRLILAGELRPGDRVPQDRIAAELGMSRIPVREALIGLDLEGLVRIEAHRGVFVAAVDETMVRDHFDLLALAFGFAVRRAMTRWSDDDDRALAGLHDAFLGSTDPAARELAARSFHLTVARAARSRGVRTVLRAMRPTVPGEYFAWIPEALEDQAGHLQAIAAALRARDAERAVRCYAEMMRANADILVEAYRARGLFDGAT